MESRERTGSDSPGHVAALDGLRAVAVLAVLGYHGGVAWLGGGFLGVSAFFTLSGFLITSLLLREWDGSGDIDLRRFWSRRFRRLLPASWATIGVVLVTGGVGVWDVEQLRALRGDVPWSLAELVNWHFVEVGNEYSQSVALPSPLLHYWSLAIEQQFYLLLPLLLIGVLTMASALGARSTGRGRLVLGAVLVVLAGASAVACGVHSGTSVERAYFGTDTRAAEMLLGALLAVVAATPRRSRVGAPRPAARAAARLGGLAGMAGVVGLGWMLTTASVADAWLYPWGLLATAACTVGLIVGAVQPGPVGFVLSLGPLVALGRISYGVYLIHWPVFLWLTPERTGRDGAGLLAVRTGVTLAIAAASYRWLEQPIRAGRTPRPSAAMRLVPAAGISLLLVGSVVTGGLPAPPSYLQPRAEGTVEVREPDLPPDAATPTVGVSAPPSSVAAPSTAAPPAPAPASPSTAPAPPTPVPTPSPPPPVRSSRVLLVGDSVAVSLEDALGDVLVSLGVGFGSAAAPGCGVVIGYPTDEQGRVSEMTRPCAGAIPRHQLEAVASVRPDLVVVMSTWEMTNREVDGVWYRFGTPEADAVLVHLLTQAVDRLSSGGAAVALVAMPEPVDGRVQPVGPAEVGRSRHLNGLLARVAASHRGRVTTIGFDEIVCPADPCPAVVDGRELRGRDGRHFDEPAAAHWASARLVERVLSVDLARV